MNFMAASAIVGLRALYDSSTQMRWAFASQIITSAANFVTTLIIVRSLGLQDFGRFSVCFLLLMISRNFLIGILLTPMSIIAPKLRKPSRRAYDGFLVLSVLIFSIGASFLLYALAMPLGVLLKAPWLVDLALPLAMANLTASFADFFRRYHFIHAASAWAFFIDAVRFGTQLLLLMIFAFALRDMFSIQSALYALSLAAIIGAAIGALHNFRPRLRTLLTRAVWPRHWNFIKWMTPSLVLEMVQANAPLFILGAVLGDAALGLVRAMQSLANILNLPINAMAQIAPSMAASIYTRSGFPALQNLLTRMAVFGGGIVIIASIIAIAYSPIIIERGFAVDLSSALTVFIWYCAVNLLLILRLPLQVYFQVLERPRILLLADAVGAMVSIPAIFWAISIWSNTAVPMVNFGVVLLTGIIYLAAIRSSLRVKHSDT